MTEARYKGVLKDQSGAVAATYALALIPLIAIAGLAFDYTRLVGMDSELQNAADQAALAGASQLTRRPGSMEAAIAAIQGGLVSNSTRFSNDGTGSTIDVNTADICFYSSKANAESGTDCFTDVTRFAEAGFVQVTVETRAANFALTPIVGAISESLAGSAVAGLGTSLCRIPPLMICNPYESGSPTGEEPFDFDDAAGKGLLAKPGGGSQWTPGNYGYLDVGVNGATGVRQALGWDGPPGDCLSQDGVDPDDPGTVDTQTGNIASGPQAINTRFDTYSTQGCVAGGTCSPSLNSRKDLVRPLDLIPAMGNSCAIGNGGWREPTNAYHPTDLTTPYAGPIDSMGHPRDVCHAVEDGVVGNCKNDPIGTGLWDRDAYFLTHFGWTQAQWQAALAGATLENSPNIANISRFDVYKWEEDAPATRLADTPAGATGSDLVTRNQPVCGQQYSFTPATDPADRRRMTVAVINCNLHTVNGNSTGVPVTTWVDVFVVQPSTDRGPGNKWTRKDEIYTEVIGETDISRAGAPVGPTVRRDVPYLVR